MQTSHAWKTLSLSLSLLLFRAEIWNVSTLRISFRNYNLNLSWKISMDHFTNLSILSFVPFYQINIWVKIPPKGKLVGRFNLCISFRFIAWGCFFCRKRDVLAPKTSLSKWHRRGNGIWIWPLRDSTSRPNGKKNPIRPTRLSGLWAAGNETTNNIWW